MIRKLSKVSLLKWEMMGIGGKGRGKGCQALVEGSWRQIEIMVHFTES